MDHQSIKETVKPKLSAKTSMVPTFAPKVSEFDHIIHKTAKANRMDWRLIASIIKIESSFKPHVKSSAGAMGLMQIMPAVAKDFKVKDAHAPEENVSAGTRHFIRWIQIIKADTDQDRLKMALAAYNAGLGHLRDAQKLARRYGKNPYKWSDLEKMYLKLQNKRYYKYVKHGFCRGQDVLNYVKKVTRQYNKFKSWYALKPGLTDPNA